MSHIVRDHQVCRLTTWTHSAMSICPPTSAPRSPLATRRVRIRTQLAADARTRSSYFGTRQLMQFIAPQRKGSNVSYVAFNKYPRPSLGRLPSEGHVKWD